MQTQSRLSYFQLSIFYTLHWGPHFLDQYFLIFFFDRNQIRKPSLPKLKGSKTHLLLLYFKLNQISPLIYLLTIGRCDCHLLIMIQAIIVLLFYKHRIGTMYIVSFTIFFIDLNFNLFAFQSYLLICFKCVSVSGCDFACTRALVASLPKSKNLFQPINEASMLNISQFNAAFVRHAVTLSVCFSIKRYAVARKDAQQAHFLGSRPNVPLYTTFHRSIYYVHNPINMLRIEN